MLLNDLDSILYYYNSKTGNIPKDEGGYIRDIRRHLARFRRARHDQVYDFDPENEVHALIALDLYDEFNKAEPAHYRGYVSRRIYVQCHLSRACINASMPDLKTFERMYHSKIDRPVIINKKPVTQHDFGKPMVRPLF